ncbi:MAG: 30S ribosomal protein S9, partial [Candidatus Obscuribacterales bacterium]|nr:30S ribosomal protein S9 [Candidatus Obscuribacterales bacterium]
MTSVIQYYGTGRRKTATARVRLIPGTGKVTINNRTIEDYVGNRPGLAREIALPFETADAQGRFDVIVNVCGGGIV